MEGLGLGWFGFLIVGLLAGWIAEKVMKRDQGLLTNLVVGVVGAYLGAFVFRLLGISTAGSFLWALIVSVVGAVLLLAIVGAVRRRS